MSSILVSETILVPQKGDSRTVGATRRYHPACTGYNARWTCCGKDRGHVGCMQAKHIDDRIPGEVERIKDIAEAAWAESRTTVYRACKKCDKDVIVEDDAEDSDLEERDGETLEETDEETDDVYSLDEVQATSSEKDILAPQEQDPSPGKEVEVADEKTEKEERSVAGEEARTIHEIDPAPEVAYPDELSTSPRPVARLPFFGAHFLHHSRHPELEEEVPSPTRQKFLCHSCTEEAAAKKLHCTVCGDIFKALPSYDAYTAEKPICGDCFWTHRSAEVLNCFSCGDAFYPSMQSPWYDDEERSCPQCKEEEDEEDMKYLNQHLGVGGGGGGVRSRDFYVT